MVTASQEQPVRVAAQPDPEAGRWLWLVKWLLAIPHYVVLFFLDIAVLVVTVIAFFAVLFTGRYPRALFDFTLGVMRWNWRVAYYSYGALATDRYPPFSLGAEPDYPATLDVHYPEQLSRGLVLVKWWLLAIPHYLVLDALITNTSVRLPLFRTSVQDVTYGANSTMITDRIFEPSLHLTFLGLLTLIVALALLFTGRYPKGLYAFVVGVHRWAIRVGAYALLMTDSYPPFRLDQGADDPEVRAAEEPEVQPAG
ncbi:membrane protein [Lentzea aerocolonigenes]|uniref:Membrane protein n=1 Tax=Lentzea aerocolonigenes TaxID=68170 RepID=A0A0F0H6J3_LENAE|nr:membrane protein [Lentzea aerocolonigenes]